MNKPQGLQAVSVDEAQYGPGEITEEKFDSMPEDYKACVREAIKRQALGEMAAAAIFCRLAVRFYDEGEPARMAFAAHIAEEEAGHSEQITAILPGVGLSKDIYKNPSLTYGEVFGGEKSDLESWEAMIMFNWLAEEAGTMFLRSFKDTSYKPWRDTMKSILEEEEGHGESGINNLIRYLRRFPENKPLVQAQLDKWFPISLKLLGVPGSEKQQKYHRYGLKAQNSAEQIPVWLNSVLPQLRKLGLRVPTVDEAVAQGVVLPEGVTW